MIRARIKAAQEYRDKLEELKAASKLDVKFKRIPRKPKFHSNTKKSSQIIPSSPAKSLSKKSPSKTSKMPSAKDSKIKVVKSVSGKALRKWAENWTILERDHIGIHEKSPTSHSTELDIAQEFGSASCASFFTDGQEAESSNTERQTSPVVSINESLPNTGEKPEDIAYLYEKLQKQLSDLENNQVLEQQCDDDVSLPLSEEVQDSNRQLGDRMETDDNENDERNEPNEHENDRTQQSLDTEGDISNKSAEVQLDPEMNLESSDVDGIESGILNISDEEIGNKEGSNEECGDEESSNEESGDEKSSDEESGDKESSNEESGDNESSKEESYDKENGKTESVFSGNKGSAYIESGEIENDMMVSTSSEELLDKTDALNIENHQSELEQNDFKFEVKTQETHNRTLEAESIKNESAIEQITNELSKNLAALSTTFGFHYATNKWTDEMEQEYNMVFRSEKNLVKPVEDVVEQLQISLEIPPHVSVETPLKKKMLWGPKMVRTKSARIEDSQDNLNNPSTKNSPCRRMILSPKRVQADCINTTIECSPQRKDGSFRYPMHSPDDVSNENADSLLNDL